MKIIKGKFSVKSSPLSESSVARELGLMQMKFEKHFEGALKAQGLVLMMGLLNKESGSGGYVAIEKIEGEVESQKGSFFLQHNCSMSKGVQLQSITVLPESGTGALLGLKGEMTIEIVDGQHFYNFQYELPSL